MSDHDVILVRHGQTEWSASGKHTGRTDIPLTELGRRQADALREMLHHRPFARVLASPLMRAWQTMERAGYGDVAVATDDLMEWDYGEYEGRRTDDIRVDVPGWSVWTHPVTGGESLSDIGARADRVIAQANAEDGPVALFAHGHLLRVLAARWIELPPEAGRHLRLDTATVSVLGWDRENRVLRQWNESCHLRSLDPVS
ncbi:MAG: histidine phosphatase family protein [Myxococcota bacterium]